MIAVKYEYQTIEYNDNLPARIELFESQGSELRADPHWHKEIEIIYVLDGGFDITKNDLKTKLKSGDIFILNSGEIHNIDVLDGDKIIKAVIAHLSFEFAKQFDDSLDFMYFRIDSNTQAESKLKDLMKRLADSKSHSEEDFPGIKQYGLIMDIFHVLFTSCRRKKQISLYGNCNVNFRNAKVAMEYIEEHYREDINLNVMAELVGLNPIYFSKYFKDTTGQGFNTYLGTVRLKHALDDLLNHGMSIADAAKCNGFPSVKSFETVCKRSYGLTPLQFKKQQLRVS